MSQEKTGYATHRGMRCFIDGPTKNVTLNSKYIEDYETIPLSIGQLDNIEPVGIDHAISLV